MQRRLLLALLKHDMVLVCAVVLHSDYKAPCPGMSKCILGQSRYLQMLTLYKGHLIVIVYDMTNVCVRRKKSMYFKPCNVDLQKNSD